MRLCALICFSLFSSNAFAQAANQYTVADANPGGAIVDVGCGTANTITRTINVPTHYTIGDVDFGMHLTHTYRSDLQITLKSPAGTTIAIMTNTAGSGDNLNDLFDDEAATAISTHNATVTDPAITNNAVFPYWPIAGTYPYYSHVFKPAAALSAFDNQDAFGNWTITLCDSVAQDIGNFKRADLFITATGLSITKTSNVESDGVSVINPKSVPGAIIKYCILVINNGGLSQTNVVVADPLPTNTTLVPSTLFTGTTCSGAVTPEDIDAIGADESDPYGISVSGSTVSGSALSLTAGMTFAMVFSVTIN